PKAVDIPSAERLAKRLYHLDGFKKSDVSRHLSKNCESVDIPSAERLAKRLYHLDGFKISDVSKHLRKNNEFSRAVAEEYVKHFEFGGVTLDSALRTFLSRFALSGETQERERVLVHFSRRYLECNPGSFNSQGRRDARLGAADLPVAVRAQRRDAGARASAGALLEALPRVQPGLLQFTSGFRRMSCAEFIDNLADLNDGDNFPRDTLKHLYQAIRAQPLLWALDTETSNGGGEARAAGPPAAVGGNPFLDVPDQSRAVEIHHALATKATDYTKKQHVFRLQTADQAEYLFQTSDSKELCSWVETVNFVCAAYSAAPLAGAVGSQRKFQRPLLPCTHTKLSMVRTLLTPMSCVRGWRLNFVCAAYSAAPLAGAVGSQR
ncbi:putative arf6 guanine nucleotide exchange factor, partial [Operophtera brumata]